MLALGRGGAADQILALEPLADQAGVVGAGRHVAYQAIDARVPVHAVQRDQIPAPALDPQFEVLCKGHLHRRLEHRPVVPVPDGQDRPRAFPGIIGPRLHADTLVGLDDPLVAVLRDQAQIGVGQVRVGSSLRQRGHQTALERRHVGAKFDNTRGCRLIADRPTADGQYDHRRRQGHRRPCRSNARTHQVHLSAKPGPIIPPGTSWGGIAQAGLEPVIWASSPKKPFFRSELSVQSTGTDWKPSEGPSSFMR